MHISFNLSISCTLNLYTEAKLVKLMISRFIHWLPMTVHWCQWLSSDSNLESKIQNTSWINLILMVGLRIYEFLKYLKLLCAYNMYFSVCVCVCVRVSLSFSWGYDRDGCAFGRRAVLVNSHRSVTNGKDCEAGVWSNLDRNLIMIHVNKPRIITVLRNDKQSIDRFTSGCRKLKNEKKRDTMHHLSRRFSFWINIHLLHITTCTFLLRKSCLAHMKNRLACSIVSVCSKFCQVFYNCSRINDRRYLDYSPDKKKFFSSKHAFVTIVILHRA